EAPQSAGAGWKSQRYCRARRYILALFPAVSNQKGSTRHWRARAIQRKKTKKLLTDVRAAAHGGSFFETSRLVAENGGTSVTIVVWRFAARNSDTQLVEKFGGRVGTSWHIRCVVAAANQGAQRPREFCRKVLRQ